MEELYFKLTSPDSDGLTDEEFEEYKKLTTPSEINERKVLKVGTSAPQAQNTEMDPQEEMPMNDMPQGDMPPMNAEMPTNDNDSDFDTNFDAGVEADEDEDPKKYIQQLTGKLSQELGKYNNELGEPDVELSKYVGGMIVKQVAKNLDEPGKKELIKKINTTNSSAEEETPEDIEMPEDDMTTNETYTMSGKEIKEMMESFNTTLDVKNDETSVEKPISKKTAFTPKKFN